MGALVQQQLAEHLQAVAVDIELMEMVETRVTRDLQFLRRRGPSCEKELQPTNAD